MRVGESDDAALDKLANTGGVGVKSIVAWRAVEKADDATKKELARELYYDLSSAARRSFAWDTDHHAIYLLLFAGDLQFARQQARELLKKQRDAFSSRWERKCLEFIADPSLENEKKLQQLAGPFSSNHAYADWAIGMVAFGRGDRDTAERHLRLVIDAGRVDWGNYCAAKALLKRMEDSDWPMWIDATGRD